jgi:hypothetical protein
MSVAHTAANALETRIWLRKKREVKGGGEEQFELLLVLIDALEEPDLVWL